MNWIKIGLTVSTLLAVLACAGCATSVSARHTPLYRASPHASTIVVKAANSSAGIQGIQIVVTRGTMTDCTELGGPPSVIPCRTNAVITGYGCGWGPTPPTNATCNVNLNLGNGEMVTYKATATPGMGSSVSTQEITFSGGAPPVTAIARPIWWHREIDPARRIDVGFFPDSDYSSYATFTGDLEPIVLGAFFNPDQQFSGIYTLFRESHNLWAGPAGANAEGCSRTFNSVAASVSSAMDGKAIVHSNDFRDCASISLGGAGSVYANAGDPDWILIHESGHFLHGQADEYCCDGGYANAGTCRNSFTSQSDCQTYASGNGFATSLCKEIASGPTHTGKWRLDDGNLETMEDRVDTSDWLLDSRKCVLARYTTCAGGSCY